jgi:hypothetical protein
LILLGISQYASVPRRPWLLRGAVSIIFTALTISVLDLQRRSASDRKTEVSRKGCNRDIKMILSYQNNTINYLLHKHSLFLFFFSHFSVEKNDKGNSNKRAQYLPLLSAHANPTFFSFSQVTSPAEI